MTNTPASSPLAAEFFKGFVEEVASIWRDQSKFREDFTADESWTKAVLPLIKKLGHARFGYPEKFGKGNWRGITSEYYRIDQCWFSYTGSGDDPRDTWNLDVAIEHENKHNDYGDEVRKLLAIRCPLRCHWLRQQHGSSRGAI